MTSNSAPSFKPSFPPFLRVSGDNFEMGYQIGVHFKAQIRDTLHNFPVFYRNRDRSLQNSRTYDTVLGATQKLFPQYVEELRGYAEGAQVSFQDIFIQNCMHVYGYEGCSTGIFTFDEHTTVVQNEDWWPILGKNAYFLVQDLEDGTSFFVYAYPGILPGMSFGFNSHGLFFCCNGLTDPTLLFGPSRLMFGRSMFEQSTLEDLLRAAVQHSPRSGGANYNIVAMSNNQVVNLETTRSSHFQTRVTDRFFHTNHYVSEKFRDHFTASDRILCTISRYEGGTRILDQVPKTTSGLRSILWDDSVFLTGAETHTGELTLATAVVEISQNDDIQLRFHPGVRDPTQYQDYSYRGLFP